MSTVFRIDRETTKEQLVEHMEKLSEKDRGVMRKLWAWIHGLRGYGGNVETEFGERKDEGVVPYVSNLRKDDE